MNMNSAECTVSPVCALLQNSVAPKTCLSGPVGQSIVSLTSLLKGQLVKCFATL